MTGRLGAERRESEARLETAQKRCDREREELLRLGKKYGLTEEDWRGVRYDPKEEAHQEEQEEEQREKLAVWENRIQETRIREALIRQEREQKLAELRGRCALPDRNLLALSESKTWISNEFSGDIPAVGYGDTR